MLEIKNLSKKYENTWVLRDISFKVEKGEKLAIIGLSGSGKTTLANLISNVLACEDNKIFIDKIDKNLIDRKNYCKKVSIVFQEYQSSFNPKMSIKEILEEPFKIHNLKIDEEKIKEMLKITYLDKIDLDKNVKHLSGGEKQRLNIARIMLLNPEILILDEVVSSLDIHLALEIIDILNDLNKKYNLTILFITHNINLIRFLTEKILVLKDGEIVDQGNMYTQMSKEYTKNLLKICK